MDKKKRVSFLESENINIEGDDCSDSSQSSSDDEQNEYAFITNRHETSQQGSSDSSDDDSVHFSSVSKGGSPKKNNVLSKTKQQDQKTELAKTNNQKKETAPEDERPRNNIEDWPKEDILMLLTRIDKVIPKNDSLKYTSRVRKIDWAQVQFDNYSMHDCREKWRIIQKKLRKFRLLRELVSDAIEWADKPWIDFYRSGRKNRHPDMPKRPLSSFMLYYLDKKDAVAKLHPGLDMTEISKLIANEYHGLPNEKKEKYNQKAEQMRVDYRERMKTFTKEHPVEAAVISRKADSKKNALLITMPGPSKPVTPLKLFLEEKLKQSADNEGLSKSESVSRIKNLWKTMTGKKKIPWIRWAHETELKYLEELKIYKSENPKLEIPAHKSVLSREEQKILERTDGKPEKPPNSAYSLFSRLLLKDSVLREKFTTPKERMKEIAHLWQNVSDREKEAYSEKAKHLMDNYKLEYATYLETLSEDKREEELDRNRPKRKNRKPVKTKRVKVHQEASSDQDNSEGISSRVRMSSRPRLKQIYGEEEKETLDQDSSEAEESEQSSDSYGEGRTQKTYDSTSSDESD